MSTTPLSLLMGATSIEICSLSVRNFQNGTVEHNVPVSVRRVDVSLRDNCCLFAFYSLISIYVCHATPAANTRLHQ